MQKNIENNKELTPKKHKAIVALMEERTIAEAAEKAGVGERTLYRWLKEPDFKTALIEAETQHAETASRRLAYGTRYALDTLLRIMAGKYSSDSTRLGAARAWLDIYSRTRDDRDLDRRITALESKQ